MEPPPRTDPEDAPTSEGDSDLREQREVLQRVQSELQEISRSSHESQIEYIRKYGPADNASLGSRTTGRLITRKFWGLRVDQDALALLA